MKRLALALLLPQWQPSETPEETLRRWLFRWFALAALLLLAAPAAAETIAGPIAAEVVRVIDGDTLEVRARLWPGLVAEELVRLRGLDTPELRGRCAAEKEAARRARQALAGLAGPVVTLEAVERDKYGRILARVMSADGRDVAAVLIASGLARAYAGEARRGWC